MKCSKGCAQRQHYRECADRTETRFDLNPATYAQPRSKGVKPRRSANIEPVDEDMADRTWPILIQIGFSSTDYIRIAAVAHSTLHTTVVRFPTSSTT